MIAGLRRSRSNPSFTNRRAADKNVIERGGRETFGRWQCDTSARRHIFPAPRETIFDQIAQRLRGGTSAPFGFHSSAHALSGRKRLAMATSCASVCPSRGGKLAHTSTLNPRNG